MAFLAVTTVTNLGETDISVPTTDQYSVRVSLQLPNIVPAMSAYGAGGGAGTGTGGGPQVNSQVVTVIKQNSTTKYTSNAGDRGIGPLVLSCSASDIIKVITSSSLAQDNQPQAIQVTIAISEGAE
jgi:hypothetical protein